MTARATTLARLGFAAVGLTLASAAFGTLSSGEPETAGAKAVAAQALAGAVDKAKGRDLFSNWGCNSCHTLADAGATGHVGPSLDGDANLTRPFVIDRVTNGQGAMPSFGGQLTDQEIAELAAYVVEVRAK